MRVAGEWKNCAIACLFMLIAVSASEASEIQLRAAWSSPNDRSLMELCFARDPLIIMLPGDNLQIGGIAPDGPCTIVLMKDGQPYRQDENLAFTAPDKPGAYYIPLRINSPGMMRDCQICVLVPYRASGRKTNQGWDLQADGQNIGHYRHPSRSGNQKVKNNPDSYQPPVWWFRITPQNSSFEIMPGLTAGELVVPSEDTGKPHTDMVPVVYPMWQTICTLRQELSQNGIPGEAMQLISMFRAPAYNRSIGSNAFGRHIYGDAFDFYIDLDGQGKAADLNRDGKLDRRDAYPIVALIENLQADGKIPMGGIGVYNSVGGDHVVTMHLDLRGHRATWGYRYGAGGKRSEFSWQSERFAQIDRNDEQAAAQRAAKEGRKYAPPRREPLR